MKYYFFIICILLFFQSSVLAQTLVPDKKVRLANDVFETSGIEWLNDSVWVTHNDSGDGPVLYFMNPQGELLFKREIPGATSVDWEDISFDGKDNLFIADLGNNLNNRKNLKIYRYSLSDSSVLSFDVKYADQNFPVDEKNKNFDCEAISFYQNKLFLFTKDYSEPYTGITKNYILDFNKSDTILSVADSLFLGNGGYLKHSVTSADISDDGKKMVLLTYKHLYLFEEISADKILSGKYIEFILPEIQQREAICFDSLGNIWMTDEKSRLKNGAFLYYYDMQKIYSAGFYYRDPSIGIVTAKVGGAKRDGFMEFSQKELMVDAKIDIDGEYEVEVIENGVAVKNFKGLFQNKINIYLSVSRKSLKNNSASIRIYKEKKLVYANKIKSEN